MRKRIRALTSAIIAAVVLACGLRGEEVDSPLVPLAAQYDRAIAELTSARSAKIAELTAAYLKRLDEALVSATDAEAAAAVRKEREGIVDGLLAPGKIPALPPEIEAAHRAFFGAVSQASLDFEAAKKKADAAYVKELTTLSSRNKKNPALIRAIAAEKRRILYGTP